MQLLAVEIIVEESEDSHEILRINLELLENPKVALILGYLLKDFLSI